MDHILRRKGYLRIWYLRRICIPLWPMTCQWVQNAIQTTLYADDTYVYKASQLAKIALRRLDIHINRTLVPNLDKNKIKINPTKTESLILTKRQSDSIITN